jgi:hypothetical protein
MTNILAERTREKSGEHLAERTRDHQRPTAPRDALTSPRVFAGLDPAIHDEAQRVTSVQFWRQHGLMDARVKKPAHDAECVEPQRINMSGCRNHRAALFRVSRYDRPAPPTR